MSVSFELYGYAILVTLFLGPLFPKCLFLSFSFCCPRCERLGTVCAFEEYFLLFFFSFVITIFSLIIPSSSLRERSVCKFWTKICPQFSKKKKNKKRGPNFQTRQLIWLDRQFSFIFLGHKKLNFLLSRQ